MINEFKDFIAKGNVMDMAVGIIIGAAFTAIVGSLVEDLVNPIISLFMGGIDFSSLGVKLGEGEDAAVFAYGKFIMAVINFLIIAFVVFMLVKAVNKSKKEEDLKEVLKQTSERRGEPSAPDVDPYWNRDFGYGMIDAYSATKLAMYLKENGITELIDPSIQNHLLSKNDNNTIQLTGHSWSQSGSVESVKFRIDGGSWYDANFNSSITEVSALTPFEWYVNIDSNKLSEGNHTLEVTAFSSTGQSLPVTVLIEGEGNTSSSYSIPSFVYILVAVVALIWLSVLILLRYQNDSQISSLINRFGPTNNDDIIDAEIVD